MIFMKKALIFLLTAAISLSLGIIPASAVAFPYLVYGDVDYNCRVEINDATLLQKYLAGTAELYYNQLLMSDYDHNGKITIADVTGIQKEIAGARPEGCGGFADTYVDYHDFYAELDSGAATKGREVTFVAVVGDGTTCEFFVNDELVQARSENNKLNYVFEEAGDYRVSLKAYNKDGVYHSADIFYQVVESIPDDVVRVSYSHFDESNTGLSFNVKAEGGSGEYTYSFKITQEFADFYGEGFPASDIEVYKKIGESKDNDWEFTYDERGLACLYIDYSENSSLYIDKDLFDWDINSLGDYPLELTITAKDSNGKVSKPKVVELMRGLICG